VVYDGRCDPCHPCDASEEVEREEEEEAGRVVMGVRW
jgi:hypothetical protein